MNGMISRRDVLRAGVLATAGVIACPSLLAQTAKRRVVVWSEGTAPKSMYPNDINGAIGDALKPLANWEVVLASLKDPDQGVSDELLKKTDVLIWWGHQKHGQVKDELVAKIDKRVREEGMGFISVHSSHFAKPYKKLMGSPCTWGAYTVDGSTIKITVADPNHPICKGVNTIEFPKTERYAEPFAVPTPEAAPLECTYKLPNGQEQKARQGLCWTIGKGKVFYLQTGHETFPELLNKDVQQIFRNAVEWAAPKS